MTDSNVIHLPKTKKVGAPRLKFTRTSIAALLKKAEGKTGVLARDEIVQGLALRRQMRDAMFVVERKVKGRQRRVTVAQYDPRTYNAEEIRNQAREIIGDLTSGRYDVTRAEKAQEADTFAHDRMLLSEVIDRFIVGSRARKRAEAIRPATVLSYRNAVRAFGDMPVAKITPSTVEQRYAVYVRDHSPASANTMLRGIRRVWNVWAAARPDGAGQCPVSLKDTAPSPKRSRALTEALRRPWYETLTRRACQLGPEATATNAIRFLFVTGLRLNEAAGLKWADIAGDEIVIPASRMKAAVELRRPITDEMQNILSMQMHFHGEREFVFPSRTGRGHVSDLRKAFHPINEEILGAPSILTAHDLRRTYIGAARVAAVPELASSLLVGHAVRDIHDEYAVASVRERLPEFAAVIESALLDET